MAAHDRTEASPGVWPLKRVNNRDVPAASVSATVLLKPGTCCGAHLEVTMEVQIKRRAPQVTFVWRGKGIPQGHSEFHIGALWIG